MDVMGEKIAIKELSFSFCECYEWRGLRTALGDGEDELK
jgi:hypothetical protein